MRRSAWTWSSAMVAGVIVSLLGAHGAIYGRGAYLSGGSSASPALSQAPPVDRRKGFVELGFGIGLLAYGWHLRRKAG